MRLSGVYPGQGSNRLGDLGAILGVVCIARILSLNVPNYMGLVARDISSMYWSSRSSAEASQWCWAQNFSPVR